MTTEAFRAPGFLFFFLLQNSLSSETFKHDQMDCTLWVCESLQSSSSRSHACSNSSPPRCLIKELSSLLPQSHSFDQALPPLTIICSAGKAVTKKGAKILIVWE